MLQWNKRRGVWKRRSAEALFVFTGALRQHEGSSGSTSVAAKPSVANGTRPVISGTVLQSRRAPRALAHFLHHGSFLACRQALDQVIACGGVRCWKC